MSFWSPSENSLSSQKHFLFHENPFIGSKIRAYFRNILKIFILYLVYRPIITYIELFVLSDRVPWYISQFYEFAAKGFRICLFAANADFSQMYNINSRCNRLAKKNKIKKYRILSDLQYRLCVSTWDKIVLPQYMEKWDILYFSFFFMSIKFSLWLLFVAASMCPFLTFWIRV